MTEYGISENDAAKFLARIIDLARRNRLKWEKTAAENVLTAPFKDEYVFSIGREDPEEQWEGFNYTLSVSKGRQRIMWFTPASVGKSGTLQALLGEDPKKVYPYTLFTELWERAFFAAHRVGEEFEKLSKLLSSELDSK